MGSKVKISDFGLIGNKKAEQYHIEFPGQLKASLCNFGGIIKELYVPNSEGEMINICLGFESIEDYFEDTFYIGALIGRFANRIHNGRFELNNKIVQLSQNQGNNHLHGGFKGFHKTLWQLDGIEENEDEVKISLVHNFRALEEGYPGNLNVKVDFTFNHNQYKIEYRAISDQDSIFNPTHHSYFNLSGNHQEKVFDHRVQIHSSEILEIDENGIPSGRFINITGSPFDLKQFQSLEDLAIIEKGKKILNFDHCYVFDPDKKRATIYHPGTGIELTVETDRPGMQFYTANFFEEVDINKQKAIFKKNNAICLEPQLYPDSPNHENFSNSIIKANSKMYSSSTYKIKLKK